MNKIKPELIWVDCEMTGLDTTQHVILEVAICVTDTQGNLVDEGIDIIVNQSNSVFDAMGDYVTEMHEKSGLIKEVEKSRISLVEAEAQCIEYLNRVFPDDQTLKSAPMCGNSIGVDRRFLDVSMKDLNEAMHYRSIDVSTLKEIFRRVKPNEFKNRPDKKACHRALDDVLESIEEYKYYLKFL
jgi:oligoribonuclease